MTTKCIQCGGDYDHKIGNLKLTDKYVGDITVQDADYCQCKECDDLLISSKTSRKFDKQRSEVLQELLQSRPLRDFVSASEAIKMLRISRQAFHKHRRIKRGFIFQTLFNGRTVYLKESVRRFKDHEDGRYRLRWPETSIECVSEYGVQPFLRISGSSETKAGTQVYLKETIRQEIGAKYVS